MKNGKIGLGLIGAGRAGMIHARNYRSSVPHAYIAAVADPCEENVQSALKELEIEKGYADYRELLEDSEIDAVIIVTPTKYHCEIAVAAAERGKHILCEKPMAMTVSECELMEAAAKKNHVILQMAFMRRFDSAFMAAKAVVESGDIGDVVMVRSNTRGPSIPKPWMYDIQKSNGPLAEVNSHDIDTLRWFTGSEFRTIYAVGGNYRCPDARADFPDFYDNVILSASFENGMQGMIDGAQGVLYGYDARAEILGTKGCIYLGRTQERGITVCRSDMRKYDEFTNSWKFLFKDAYLEEDIDFADCILNARQPKVTGHDGKMAVKVVNAGNESIKSGQIITL
ncbi:Gfo/Idh/MocA family oxidoreductase [Faecalicatena orotica]|uniref:Myo-inositol 2-dehydrogenase/D-chiro-inositol 1-dehydrogenase/scyllo-inositol 2-dehydrogenase (NAD+) n=1 Tax=Faecalicatena orotica TaxID=1544 RepID=A0A2Y9BMD7_9FIRM|nr:Gfo/Idh/MocA family oxidoreductase [Faecalicatena orotica]PWJ23686.1 myo-inositol 2-dehydrogenase/D-chiro-inositol 1-dehydrogenase/scyllo-inositol 2-dehydrogenase (NAD+) [Faecalicatena orotica]SSA57598.1 myo-inositol 2-dehydrogenase / D-chiro-inositol 1-dehydrogenase/scyllo-inositol 2-dehydrogenase (NAD+) [Faecalicatena orotica]